MSRIIIIGLLGCLLVACGQPTTGLPLPTQVSPTASAPAATDAPATAAASPSAATSPALPSAPPDSRILSLQDPPLEGQDVRQLQEQLLALGYRQVGSADGVFGPQTEAAVTAFQTINQLTADGVVGPQTWQRLQSADATPGWAIVPIAAQQCGEYVLLGASLGDAWFDNQTTGQLLRGGESYRLFSSAGLGASVTGSAPQQRTPINPPLGESFFVELSPTPAEADAFAIGGQWDPLPHPATVVSGTAALEPYGAAVRDFLVSQGIAQPVLEPSGPGDHMEVWQADLDGDGSQETIISAQRVAGDGAPPGDYSLVLLLRGAAPIPVLAEVHPTGVSDFDRVGHRMLALFDANGDGVLELLLGLGYFESESIALHQLSDGATAERLNSWCGV